MLKRQSHIEVGDLVKDVYVKQKRHRYIVHFQNNIENKILIKIVDILVYIEDTSY